MIELPNRLTPEMSSRKLQALHFIQRFYLKHGQSPTQGEIAAGLGVKQQRVYALIRALERDGQVRRVRGKSRGIMLVNAAAQVSENEALLKLQEEGWGVVIGDRIVSMPLSVSRLPLVPELDHVPDCGIGDEHDGDQRGRA